MGRRTIIECDRKHKGFGVGQEVRSIQSVVTIKQNGTEKVYELCGDCTNKVQTVLDGGEYTQTVIEEDLQRPGTEGLYRAHPGLGGVIWEHGCLASSRLGFKSLPVH